MTPKSTFWAALAVSAVLAGQVAVAETNTPANETTDAVGTYVDPMVKNQQRCLERPGLPQWMMEHPLGFEWRLDLAKEFRSYQQTSAIADAESCNCEMLYPDWDAYRADLEAIWNDVSVNSKYVWNDETRNRFHAARDRFTNISRPLVPMVTRLCASVE